MILSGTYRETRSKNNHRNQVDYLILLCNKDDSIIIFWLTYFYKYPFYNIRKILRFWWISLKSTHSSNIQEKSRLKRRKGDRRRIIGIPRFDKVYNMDRNNRYTVKIKTSFTWIRQTVNWTGYSIKPRSLVQNTWGLTLKVWRRVVIFQKRLK